MFSHYVLCTFSYILQISYYIVCTLLYLVHISPDAQFFLLQRHFLLCDFALTFHSGIPFHYVLWPLHYRILHYRILHYRISSNKRSQCLFNFEALNVQSCKLYNNKYMITSAQITNTEIFAFIVVLVFILLRRKVLLIKRKDNINCQKVD